METSTSPAICPKYNALMGLFMSKWETFSKTLSPAFAAFFISLSASSFPWIPTWMGTQHQWTNLQWQKYKKSYSTPVLFELEDGNHLSWLIRPFFSCSQNHPRVSCLNLHICLSCLGLLCHSKLRIFSMNHYWSRTDPQRLDGFAYLGFLFVFHFSFGTVASSTLLNELLGASARASWKISAWDFGPGADILPCPAWPLGQGCEGSDFLFAPWISNGNAIMLVHWQWCWTVICSWCLPPFTLSETTSSTQLHCHPNHGPLTICKWAGCTLTKCLVYLPITYT